MAYQQFGAGVDEEHAWISEKRHLLNACDYGDSIATVQGLIKKHKAFDTDFAVHEDRFESIKADGAKLCEEVLLGRVFLQLIVLSSSSSFW